MEILFLLFVIITMLKPMMNANNYDERDKGIKNERIQRTNSSKLQ